MLEQSQRRWSPLHNLQGNPTFHEGSKGVFIGSAFRAIVVWLASHLFDFFFFVFFFFFFLASSLLDFKLSLGEVEEEEEETGEEEERST